MKDDYSYWSENLHSAYLFYTLEVDKLNKENKRLREALEKISKKKEINGCTCFYETEDGFSDCENCDVNMGCTYYIAKQALGE